MSEIETYLSEVEARLAAVPAGRWEYVPWHIAEGPSQVRAPEPTRPGAMYLLCETPGDATARFFVEAHNTDIPRLLALVRRYRRVLGKIEEDSHDRLAVREARAALEAMPHD